MQIKKTKIQNRENWTEERRKRKRKRKRKRNEGKNKVNAFLKQMNKTGLKKTWKRMCVFYWKKRKIAEKKKVCVENHSFQCTLLAPQTRNAKSACRNDGHHRSPAEAHWAFSVKDGSYRRSAQEGCLRHGACRIHWSTYVYLLSLDYTLYMWRACMHFLCFFCGFGEKRFNYNFDRHLCASESSHHTSTHTHATLHSLALHPYISSHIELGWHPTPSQGSIWGHY